jgi:CRISPR-associated endonuclease Cas1
MAFRTIVISNKSKAEYRMGYLCVRGETEKEVHISEISTLIIDSTCVSVTCALLAELVKKNVNVIFCGEKHLPISYLSPFAGNYETSENVKKQCFWGEERKAVCWRKIIGEKIANQRDLLRKSAFIEEAAKLDNYISELRDADTTNREGHAAKVYFNAIMEGDSRRSDSDLNGRLNYGYAVILSDVCREIAAAGYITQIGVWHSSRFNAGNLGSDLMEPLRPAVDEFVLLAAGKGELREIMPRVNLIKADYNNQSQYLESAVRLYVRSILRYLSGESEEIIFLKNFDYSEALLSEEKNEL